jgi:hypothetical protein
VKKLVAQQEAAKGALDLFVSVLRVTRANPCARELPGVSRQFRSHTRATRSFSIPLLQVQSLSGLQTHR